MKQERKDFALIPLIILMGIISIISFIVFIDNVNIISFIFMIISFYLLDVVYSYRKLRRKVNGKEKNKEKKINN